MPPLAHAALAASIVLSALGAVIVCLLIVAYGFTPAGEETPLRATRRLFVTRIGHAAAAACFAGTAILLAVVLAQSMHAPAPPASVDARVPALGVRVDGQEQRIERVERRVESAERAVERVTTEVDAVASPRPIPAASPEPVVLAPVAVAPPKAVKKTVPPPPRLVATPAKRVERPQSIATASRRADPLPAVERPAAERPAAERLVAERPAAVTSPDPAPVVNAPAPKDLRESVTSPAPTVVASSAAVRPTPQAVRAPDAGRPPKDFREKLRNDWRAIRRGWDSAGDDFRRALDRFRTGGE
jgi:hypothetical protein